MPAVTPVLPSDFSGQSAMSEQPRKPPQTVQPIARQWHIYQNCISTSEPNGLLGAAQSATSMITAHDNQSHQFRKPSGLSAISVQLHQPSSGAINPNCNLETSYLNHHFHNRHLQQLPVVLQVEELITFTL